MRDGPLARLGYLELLVCAVVLAAYSQYLWQYPFPQIPILFGQSPGIWVGALLTGLAFLRWIPDPWRRAGPKQFSFTLLLLLILWSWQMILSFVHQDAFTHLVWLYPVVLAMLFLKSPSRSEAHRALLVAGWLFVILIVVTRTLEITETITAAETSPALVEFEQNNYWLPLSGSLGPEGRWVGPFFHNSQTGNVAAYLVALGVAIRRPTSAVFILVGVTTLLLTSSRTSMVAAVIGAGVALLLGPYPWNRRIALRYRLVTMGLLGILTALTALLYSPNLTGRDVYWAFYWDLWQNSPWIGVGISGRNAGPEEFFQVNGHNLVIDALGIYGLIAAVMVLLVLISALALGVRSARLKETTPLVVIVTYCVIGLTQSDYNWMSVSVPWLMLMLPMLSAADTVNTSRKSADIHPVRMRA